MRVSFTDSRERALAFAMLGATQGLAAVAGQIGGGLLVTADIGGLGWRPIFLINVPIGLVTMDTVAYTTAFSFALLYNMAAAGATTLLVALLPRKPARPV